MEYKEILRSRRSVRRFEERPVDRSVLERMVVGVAQYAPTSRNARSTRLLVVTDPEKIARIAGMRDYGSAFAAGAPAVVVVMGERTLTDLWRENCAIAATMLLESLVDEGLAGCWIHVHGRPCRKDEPEGPSAEDYLRAFLPVPETCGVLCAVACGYPLAEPKPLPAWDGASAVTFF